MSLPVVIYVLTALAAVVVVLTRVRMRGGQGAGRFHVGKRLLDVHTVAGGLAVVVWLVFLIAPAVSAKARTRFQNRRTILANICGSARPMHASITSIGISSPE